MMKITGSPDKPASSANNSSRPASRQKNDNDEVDRFGIGGNSVKYAKKSEKLKKLYKLAKSKSKKLTKSKKPSKSENSPKFHANETKPSFFTPNAKTALNYLQLAFIKALILSHFDPNYQISIKTYVLEYAIDELLS